MTKFKAITASRHDEALDEQPPALQTSLGFLVGEAMGSRVCGVAGVDRTTFRAFARVGDDHFEAVTPVTVAEFRALIPTALMADRHPNASGYRGDAVDDGQL